MTTTHHIGEPYEGPSPTLIAGLALITSRRPFTACEPDVLTDADIAAFFDEEGDDGLVRA